jgi:hypothetical protein
MQAILDFLARPWTWWAGGLAIGLFAVLLAGSSGRMLGVSSGFGSVCGIASRRSFFRTGIYAERWRLWFVVGIPLGGFASALLTGDTEPRSEIGTFEQIFGASLATKVVVLFLGGVLVGYGARWGGG